MFIALFIALVALIVIHTALWRGHKCEQDTANRLAGDTKRAVRHRAEDANDDREVKKNG